MRKRGVRSQVPAREHYTVVPTVFPRDTFQVPQWMPETGWYWILYIL